MKLYRLPLIVVVVLLLAVPFCASAAPSPAPAPAAPQAQQVQQPQQRRITPQEAFALVAGEAEKGSLAAMVRLGSFYEQGLGVGRNFLKAREWYEKAAQAGSLEALYNLGVCYEIGIGTSGDMKEAVRYYEQSAEKGFSLASYKLATMYTAGVGVGRDNAKAVSFLTRAADGGFGVAANDLGVLYLRGDLGLTKDPVKAHDMFGKAATLGVVDAMKNIAVLYKDGIGRPASAQKAVVWYTIARKAGYPKELVDSVIDDLSKKLPAAEKKKSEREADEWFAKNFPQQTAVN